MYPRAAPVRGLPLGWAVPRPGCGHGGRASRKTGACEGARPLVQLPARDLRRGGGDIWQGLYEFPLIETDKAADFAELAATAAFRELLGNGRWHLRRSVTMPGHQLSHQLLHAVFHRIECDAMPAFPSVETAALGGYALPRLIDRYLTKYQM
jgi:hypothetical protein